MRTTKALGLEVRLDCLLAALHNNTFAMGMGAIHDVGRNLSPEEVAKDIDETKPLSVDYYRGRPIKVFERDGEVDGRLYERDAGDGAFYKAVRDAVAMGKDAE